MAKRFIDTGIFDDEWFMEVGSDVKILWIYFITKCDHAGILKINKTLCQVQTGIKDLDKIIKQLGNRIVTVSDRIYFIPKFIEFQYPDFPKSNVKQQASAIEILRKYNLIDNEGFIKNEFNSYVSVKQELSNSYGNGNGNDNDNGTDIKKESLKDQKLHLLEQRKSVFSIRVSEFRDHYPAEMLIKFFDYWSEMNKSSTQMRWEMERTWELSKRLATWASREKNFVKLTEFVTHKELVRRFNEGESDIWDKYEKVAVEGKTIPMWKLKQKI